MNNAERILAEMRRRAIIDSALRASGAMTVRRLAQHLASLDEEDQDKIVRHRSPGGIDPVDRIEMTEDSVILI